MNKFRLPLTHLRTTSVYHSVVGVCEGGDRRGLSRRRAVGQLSHPLLWKCNKIPAVRQQHSSMNLTEL